jgi:hypothetical protein
MPTERRAILTENWADFSRLINDAAASGTTHYGVVFATRRQLPRKRESIDLDVHVLDGFLALHPAEDAILNGFRWLPDSSLGGAVPDDFEDLSGLSVCGA